MKNNKKITDSYGFTLIEMLIVIVIILILSGMVLRVMKVVAQKTGTSRCRQEILQMENALAEFYSEYGQYPPGVSTNSYKNVGYEFECNRLQPQSFVNYLKNHNNPTNNSDKFFPDVDVKEYADLYGTIPGYLPDMPNNRTNNYGWGLGYNYGLVSYLWFRSAKENGWISYDYQTHWYQKDTERDKNAKRKWASYLENLTINIGRDGWYHERQSSKYIGSVIYTNIVAKVMDPWGHCYNYECRPPYLSYKLWSSGQDGKTYCDGKTAAQKKQYIKDDIYGSSGGE